jgi:hypothetical protein
MSRIVALLVLFGCVGVVGWRGIDHVDQLSGQMHELETVRSTVHRTRADLQQELSVVHEQLDLVQGELDRSSRAAEEWRSFAERLVTAEALLARFEGDLGAQSSALDALEASQTEYDPAQLTSHLENLDHEFRLRWNEASAEVREAALKAELAAASATEAMDLSRTQSDRIETLSAVVRREPDHRVMWQDLVGPVVQLAGDESVGSGVLLQHDVAGDGHTYLLTAWHVVRDIQGSLDNRDMPVPVAIFHPDGGVTDETATLLEFDAGIDIAVLRMNVTGPLPYGAALASRREMEELEIFDEIVAVGCPLGNSPIPTQGEIASTRHYVGGERYVMINANTYVGNSGGGIFDGETHALMGIFSKVYTHGSVRPTIVTHMGLITPINVVYDWLEDVGYGTLVPAE